MRRNAADAKKHLNEKVITQIINGEKMRTPVCATTASKQHINGHVITAKEECINPNSRCGCRIETAKNRMANNGVTFAKLKLLQTNLE